MDPDFKVWFKNFARNNYVALVTGSDIDKTIEQVGSDLIDDTIFSFNCSGNDVYRKTQSVYKADWVCPIDVLNYLQEKLTSSKYEHKYGNHIEHRIGMINFSIVGRCASPIERTKYYEWDKQHHERETLAKDINSKWEHIQAVVGGETGTDIFAKGHDKSRIVNHFTPAQKFVFFGDSMDEFGNDYSLAQEIVKNNRGTCHTVINWNETWNILKEKYDSNY